MTSIERFQNWYKKQCETEWEHEYGISLESCDNPGWWLKIDVKKNRLDVLTFKEISRGIGKNGHPSSKDWIRCYIENDTFHGAGDPTKLDEILITFLDWAEKS